MVFSILAGAPVWVWPVLMCLVWLGLKATKERTVSTWPIYIMPMVGVLSLNAVRGLDGGGGIWVAFVFAYLVGMRLGRRFQPGVVLSKSQGQVTLSGEWATFLVLMVVFWMNFAGGIAQAIAPEVYTSFGFHAVFAVIAGLAAGSFAGRAIGVYRACG
ncbi:hypothetical protein SAMN05444000_105180 [Shimia gijangensis]|uniref:Uncharacterized protein n=1 Tax=Shimia gijangensis TaxID=1470563 RepID=A0A1M6GZU7_9RHOB|nr:hypothetical protein [Shimia gijangensis]SHJ15499.1 hypothetical protein SAMN05444000_105180 [Shimia gijangensis]